MFLRTANMTNRIGKIGTAAAELGERKMTGNINLQKYANLLVETLPAAITNDADHKKYTSIIADMMRKGENVLSPEETEILRLLAVLVADYERNAFPIESLEPHVFLRSLLEDNFMKQRDLLPVFKTEGAVSEVLNGKRPISRDKAKELAKTFHVDFKAFL